MLSLGLLRGTAPRRSSAIMHEFIDPSYLNNKRPAVPGGAWTKELLRKKSFADLQQLWFALVKERNMLATTKQHYVAHSEELGAMPAPSRVKMVEESMQNLKLVVRERDFEANDRAVAIFRERVQRGIYRFPPGPQPPPDFNITTSKIRVTLSGKLSEQRLREIFGRYDVFEDHKGIASVTLTLSKAAMRAKQQAEEAFKHFRRETRRYEDYHALDAVESACDDVEAELAPGVFATASGAPSSPASPADDGDVSVPPASQIPVPEPAVPANGPSDTLARMRWETAPAHTRAAGHFHYYPHNTTLAPSPPPDRPTHPDEIEGPWYAEIEYDTADGYGYATSLGVTSIDGVEVLAIKDTHKPQPYASRCPIYQEAISKDVADEETTYAWPNMPVWKSAYQTYTKRRLEEIVHYNYSNVVDYVDREVLLTGKSSWEMPIDIDTSCGGSIGIPAHAKRPPSTVFAQDNFSQV